MKARLPKGYNNGGANNIQQLARQAQKLQDERVWYDKNAPAWGAGPSL